MPERSEAQEAAVKSAKRMAVPGCHASGFIALVYPLVEAGIIDKSVLLSCHSLTGYSGGGKKMIAEYESGAKDSGAQQYALAQKHKHLPEMMKICDLKNAPVFSPVVVPHYSGMQTVVMLNSVGVRLEEIKQCFSDYYASSRVVRFSEDQSDGAFISSMALTTRDDMTVSAYGNDDRIVLVSLFDNLGKGASGAAIQNMNIAIGCDETESLKIR
jgi:N-acetyl-gamma-glutamyl-phosphate reductase